MTFNPEIHHRHALRLRGHDYAQPGAYFLTICTLGREPVLGDVGDGEMRPSEAGVLVQRTWEALPERFPGIVLDAFVVMPNHVHGIVMIGGVETNWEGDTGRGNRARGGLEVGNRDSEARIWESELGSAGTGDTGSETSVGESETGGPETGDRCSEAAVWESEMGGSDQGGASPAPTRGDLPHQRGNSRRVRPATSAPQPASVGAHLVGVGLAPPVSAPPTSRIQPTPQATLGEIVGAFKSLSAIGCNRLLGRSGQPFWQRGFHDHLIRTDQALERIRWYIAANPANWEIDAENSPVEPGVRT